MSPNSEQSDRRLHQLLNRHLVAISGIYFQLDDEGNAVSGPLVFCYSSFVMSFQGNWFLVTAGHCIQDIDTKLKHKNISVDQFFLVDYFGSGATSRDSIPLDFENSFHFDWYNGKDGLDFGFIMLSSTDRSALRKNGIVPFDEGNWLRQDNVKDFIGYLLLGLPDELVKTKLSIDVVGKTNVGEAEPVLMSVDKLDELPEGSQETDCPRFIARIPRLGDLSSIKGMSGGPIFGFAEIDGNHYYWVVALQSSWDEKERIIYGCPVTVFAPMLWRALDKLCSSQEPVGSDDGT